MMGCFNSKVQVDMVQINHESQHKNNTPESNSNKSVSLHINGGGGGGEGSIKTLTFKHVMNDKLGREYFMKFLETEHAEENMAFFEVHHIV